MKLKEFWFSKAIPRVIVFYRRIEDDDSTNHICEFSVFIITAANNVSTRNDAANEINIPIFPLHFRMAFLRYYDTQKVAEKYRFMTYWEFLSRAATNLIKFQTVLFAKWSNVWAWNSFLKVHLTPNIFYANKNLCTYFKNISPLFAVFDFFMGFKTHDKLSTICRTTESEGARVHSWFDVTNCFACMFTKT